LSVIFTPDSKCVTSGAALEVRGDARHVLGLGPVVELLHHDRADLAMELLEPLVRDEPLDDLEDAAQRVEIAPHDLFDIWILNLDGDLRAVVHARDVDLTDRRRGDRPALDVREQLLG
jgi:hypothetical protein